MVLAPEEKIKIARYLRLADGLMQTVPISAFASEYEIRNSGSRLYYAFFHASLAYLISVGADIERVSRDHGEVHAAIRAWRGRIFGSFLERLYRHRKLCDYDPTMFEREYGREIEKARGDCKERIKDAKKSFYPMYHQARKAL